MTLNINIVITSRKLGEANTVTSKRNDTPKATIVSAVESSILRGCEVVSFISIQKSGSHISLWGGCLYPKVYIALGDPGPKFILLKACCCEVLLHGKTSVQLSHLNLYVPVDLSLPPHLGQVSILAA